jgi:predicted cobalt transporter CbtA
VDFARLIDRAAPVFLLAGLAGYIVLIAVGLFADWHLPYPHSFWWLVTTAAPALGVSLMFLRADARRVNVEGEEE